MPTNKSTLEYDLSRTKVLCVGLCDSHFIFVVDENEFCVFSSFGSEKADSSIKFLSLLYYQNRNYAPR